ncbi:MAG TPA: TRAM domain-containing protein [Galbitalea sp.]|nr:TRAM domain-containing protein [Galbitalea sp.]
MAESSERRGAELELEVTNVAHGGICVARHEGRVVFVSDAIPGETVIARVSETSKKSFWRAETIAVSRPSEFRQPHIWSAASIDRDPAERAGGAEFGHIRIEHQRELKRQILADALKRMAGLDTTATVEPLPGNADGTGWRTRVRLQVAENGRPGPFAARSHRVIEVTDLPLATPAVAEAAPLGELFPGEQNIDVVEPSTGGARLIVGRQKPTVVRELVGQREFRVDDAGFWQVHRAAAETLSTAVQDAVDDALFEPRAQNLDLYGGVGLLAAAIGDRFGSTTRITSVESDARATEHAGENLSDWLGARAVTARVERWVASLAASDVRLGSATVVLDPPRSGAGREVVEPLAKLAPAQIVYVACDPVALARDVALFAERGYQVDHLRAFDLFPNTHHVEAVARLVKA